MSAADMTVLSRDIQPADASPGAQTLTPPAAPAAVLSMVVSEPLPPVSNWTEREMQRYTKRITFFRRRGMPGDQVAAFAERLTARDRDLDERRACIECTHLQRDGGCFAAAQGWLGPGTSRTLAPVRDVLARCPGFEWQTP